MKFNLKIKEAQIIAAIVSQNEDIVVEHALVLSHWMARHGLSGGLRVLGLMDRLFSDGDEFGVDLLSWAARGGDEACLLLAGELCGHGKSDRWGGGALHHWAENKQESAGVGAQILLAFGVDPSRKDDWGLLPMHWSRDSGVWAWSMAALWSKGDPNGWMVCNGIGFKDVCQAMKNEGFIAWVEKSKSMRRVVINRESRGDLGENIGDWRKAWGHEMAERAVELNKMVDQQNCIAKMLGIELME